MYIKTLFSLVMIALSAEAFALPTAQIDYEDLIQYESIANDKDTGVNFEGIIALNNCSGSLIKFVQSKDDDFALMLTNGHCTGNFIEPGTIIKDEPVSRNVYLLDPKTGDKIGTLRTERIVYATMSKTDLAIYKLGVTYADIEKKYGIRALLLRAEPPVKGESIEVISGYWKKNYECTLDSLVFRIKEDKWTWNDSLKYTRECKTEHGSSGSPILNPSTREVFGINNTGNDDGARCTMDNPCEVDEKGKITVEKGRNYGQQTFWVYSCLDQSGNLDLTLAGCELPH